MTDTYEPTDLDYKGAVTWVKCPMCSVAQKVDCTSVFMIGDILVKAAPKNGKVHELRMKKWLELKAKIASESIYLRHPNMQQLPRYSEPHKISEGGSKEAEIYWNNRNKILSDNKR